MRSTSTATAASAVASARRARPATRRRAPAPALARVRGRPRGRAHAHGVVDARPEANACRDERASQSSLQGPPRARTGLRRTRARPPVGHELGQVGGKLSVAIGHEVAGVSL